MSLVGSLEDLGLGDILQIVSLSRKSGLLVLRSDAGEGRIVLQDGQVRAAFVKGEPEDLQALLVGGELVAAGPPSRPRRERARESGLSLDATLEATPGSRAERVDSLRREHVERAVLRMFTWRAGQFSFEVRDELEARDLELSLPTGINAQYLTMEASRLRDETGGGPAASTLRSRSRGRQPPTRASPTRSRSSAARIRRAKRGGRPPAAEDSAPVPLDAAREALALTTARRVERSASETPLRRRSRRRPPAARPPA